MLGSVADAEDMLQETFIRWQEASAVDIRSPRAFLVTIISCLCNQSPSVRACAARRICRRILKKLAYLPELPASPT
ncbi:MAG TPA: sigma factor [Candidatus Sulfotelmatobacter sp.]|jgi:hypothetical protein|nr:sigma factor [Candidatus Sulfotelmatobacter sp.]